MRVREVKCQIFLEFSKTVANLPDDKCPGPKPMTSEICYAGLCDTRTAAVKDRISIAIDDGLKVDTEKDDSLPDAPTPQGLIGKFQQDGLIKAMALQSNYGGHRGKPIWIAYSVFITNLSYNFSQVFIAVYFLLGYQREQNIADNDKDYEWKDAGWTTCTSSCLGGIQETKIICVEADTGSPASPINCGRAKERPDVISNNNVLQIQICTKNSFKHILHT